MRTAAELLGAAATWRHGACNIIRT
jgi:hypothetical protein